MNYHEFLGSKTWEKLRNEVLERDLFTCQKCGRLAIEVHHLNYKNGWGNTNLMFSVCRGCHRKLHRKENDDRQMWLFGLNP